MFKAPPPVSMVTHGMQTDGTEYIPPAGVRVGPSNDVAPSNVPDTAYFAGAQDGQADELQRQVYCELCQMWLNGHVQFWRHCNNLIHYRKLYRIHGLKQLPTEAPVPVPFKQPPPGGPPKAGPPKTEAKAAGHGNTVYCTFVGQLQIQQLRHFATTSSNQW